MTKTFVSIGILVGSTIGSFIPYLWGDTSFLSFSSVIFSALGAFAGIWAGFKLSQNF